MRRLREETSSPDRATARAAALLSVVPALDRDRLARRPPPAPDATQGRTAGRFRSALVLAMTLASAGAAAATLHRAGWLTGPRVPAQSTPNPVPTAPPEHAAVPPVTASPLPAVAEPVETAEAKPTAPARPSPAPRPGPATPSHAAKDAARTTPAAADDESTLIMDGVRALRRDGDPARSEALAEGALQRYPHGAQAEEAMALAMEAASARGDVPAARRAAQRYLDSFRTGRFADRAQRIVASPAR